MNTIYFTLYPKGGEISERSVVSSRFRTFKLPEIARSYVEEQMALGLRDDDDVFHYRKGFVQNLERMEKRHETGTYDSWDYNPHGAEKTLVKEIDAMLHKHGLTSVLSSLRQVMLERSARTDTTAKLHHGYAIARSVADVFDERMKFGVSVA